MPQRFELERIDKTSVKISRSGLVTMSGTMTKVGVFEYKRIDGSIVRELRLPEDVFSQESMDSFNNIPVTNGHPSVGLLDASNAKKFAVGMTGDKTTKREDTFLENELTVFDEKTINEIKNGKKELSLGYNLNIDNTPGVHPVYGQYDAIQKDIRGNHLAIVTGARAGREAVLHMDSGEDRDLATINQKGANTMPKINIKGKAFNLDDVGAVEAAQTAVTEAETESTTAIAAAEAKVTAAEEAKVTAEAEVTALKAAADAKPNSEDEKDAALKDAEAKVDSITDSIPVKNKEYATARDYAKKMLSQTAFDACDTGKIEDVKKAVVSLTMKNVNIDSKDANYVEASFDLACANFDSNASAAGSMAKAFGAQTSEHSDEEDEKLDKAKLKLQDKTKNAWKQK